MQITDISESKMNLHNLVVVLIFVIWVKLLANILVQDFKVVPQQNFKFFVRVPNSSLLW